MMKGWRWIRSWHKPYHSRIVTKFLCWYTYIITPVRQQLTTALITSIFLLLMYELYQWYIWSPVIIIFILICTILFLMLSEKQHTSTTVHTALHPQNEESLPQTTPFEFPETPVPSTPLIRVMETIDLSASDVEHFIHTTADQGSINNCRTAEQTADQPLHNQRTVEQTADQQKPEDV
jgi:Ca2+/Na+ antiporter